MKTAAALPGSKAWGPCYPPLRLVQRQPPLNGIPMSARALQSSNRPLLSLRYLVRQLLLYRAREDPRAVFQGSSVSPPHPPLSNGNTRSLLMNPTITLGMRHLRPSPWVVLPHTEKLMSSRDRAGRLPVKPLQSLVEAWAQQRTKRREA